MGTQKAVSKKKAALKVPLPLAESISRKSFNLQICGEIKVHQIKKKEKERKEEKAHTFETPSNNVNNNLCVYICLNLMFIATQFLCFAMPPVSINSLKRPEKCDPRPIFAPLR
jgi:hypothetical protein